MHGLPVKVMPGHCRPPAVDFRPTWPRAHELAPGPTTGIESNSVQLANERAASPPFHSRFYLKRWAGLDGKVAVYARRGGRVVVSRLNPRSAGFEPELYSLEKVEPTRRQAVEKEFFGRMIDDRAAVPLDAIVTRGELALTPENRVIVSHFLMSLRARHPDAVKRAKEDGPGELRRHLERNPEQYERLRSPEDPATLAAAAEKYLPTKVADFGINVLQAVISHPYVGERLFTGVWAVVDFTFDAEPTTLLTGDRPCLLEGNLAASGSYAVVLAISPTQLLTVCDSDSTQRRLRQLPGNVLFDQVNRRVISQAARYVYGVDDRHMVLVDDLLARAAA